MTEQLTRADIAEMITLLTKAVTEIGKVASAITARDMREKKHRWVWGLAVAALVGAVGLGLSNRLVIGAIEDCTKPSGQCYREGQARTGGAVAQITDEERRTQGIVCDSIDPQRRPAGCPPR